MIKRCGQIFQAAFHVMVTGSHLPTRYSWLSILCAWVACTTKAIPICSPPALQPPPLLRNPPALQPPCSATLLLPLYILAHGSINLCRYLKPRRKVRVLEILEFLLPLSNGLWWNSKLSRGFPHRTNYLLDPLDQPDLFTDFVMSPHSCFCKHWSKL